MVKRWARLLCVTSLLLLPLPARAEAPAVPYLASEALANPALVTAWLRKNAPIADKRNAALMHDYGVKEARRKAWSSAAKGLGDSAVLFPSPRTLDAYADAQVHFMGALRDARGRGAQSRERDLRTFEGLYRAALASDDVLSVLSAQERRQIEAKAQCIANYLRRQVGAGSCAPLKNYGIKR